MVTLIAEWAQKLPIPPTPLHVWEGGLKAVTERKKVSEYPLVEYYLLDAPQTHRAPEYPLPPHPLSEENFFDVEISDDERDDESGTDSDEHMNPEDEDHHSNDMPVEENGPDAEQNGAISGSENSSENNDENLVLPNENGGRIIDFPFERFRESMEALFNKMLAKPASLPSEVVWGDKYLSPAQLRKLVDQKDDTSNAVVTLSSGEEKKAKEDEDQAIDADALTNADEIPLQAFDISDAQFEAPASSLPESEDSSPPSSPVMEPEKRKDSTPIGTLTAVLDLFTDLAKTYGDGVGEIIGQVVVGRGNLLCTMLQNQTVLTRNKEWSKAFHRFILALKGLRDFNVRFASMFIKFFPLASGTLQSLNYDTDQALVDLSIECFVKKMYSDTMENPAHMYIRKIISSTMSLNKCFLHPRSELNARVRGRGIVPVLRYSGALLRYDPSVLYHMLGYYGLDSGFSTVLLRCPALLTDLCDAMSISQFTSAQQRASEHSEHEHSIATFAAPLASERRVSKFGAKLKLTGCSSCAIAGALARVADRVAALAASVFDQRERKGVPLPLLVPLGQTWVGIGLPLNYFFLELLKTALHLRRDKTKDDEMINAERALDEQCERKRKERAAGRGNAIPPPPNNELFDRADGTFCCCAYCDSMHETGVVNVAPPLPWEDNEEAPDKPLLFSELRDVLPATVSARFIQEVSLALLEGSVRSLAFYGQIQARLWRKNGDNLEDVITLYRGTNMRVKEKDVLALQIACVFSGPEVVAGTLLSRMEVSGEEILCKLARRRAKERAAEGKSSDAGSGGTDTANKVLLSPSRRLSTLSFSALHTLLSTVLDRSSIGERDANYEEEMVTRHVSSLLCARDSTCSSLQRDKKDAKLVEKILPRVSIFHSPTELQNGMYLPNEEAWKKFDPLSLAYDSTLFSSSLERYKEFCRLKNMPCAQIPLSPPPVSALHAFNQVGMLCSSEIVRQFVKGVILGACCGLIAADPAALALHALYYDIVHSITPHQPYRKRSAERVTVSDFAWVDGERIKDIEEKRKRKKEQARLKGLAKTQGTDSRQTGSDEHTSQGTLRANQQQNGEQEEANVEDDERQRLLLKEKVSLNKPEVSAASKLNVDIADSTANDSTTQMEVEESGKGSHQQGQSTSPKLSSHNRCSSLSTASMLSTVGADCDEKEQPTLKQCECGCHEVEQYLLGSMEEAGKKAEIAVEKIGAELCLLDLLFELSSRKDGLAVLAHVVIEKAEEVSPALAEVVSHSHSIQRKRAAEKELAEKKARAKARQRELMKQMNEKRKAFATMNAEELSASGPAAEAEPEVAKPASTMFPPQLRVPFPFSGHGESAPMCVLCREECTADSIAGNPIGLVAHCTKSKLLALHHLFNDEGASQQRQFTILRKLVPQAIETYNKNVLLKQKRRRLGSEVKHFDEIRSRVNKTLGDSKTPIAQTRPREYSTLEKELTLDYANDLEMLAREQSSEEELERYDHEGNYDTGIKFDEPISKSSMTASMFLPLSHALGAAAITSCRHVMHISCYMRFLKKLQESEDYNESKYNEFNCPLCKARSNTIVPLCTGEIPGEGTVNEALVFKDLDKYCNLVEDITKVDVCFSAAPAKLLPIPPEVMRHVPAIEELLRMHREVLEDTMSIALASGGNNSDSDSDSDEEDDGLNFSAPQDKVKIRRKFLKRLSGQSNVCISHARRLLDYIAQCNAQAPRKGSTTPRRFGKELQKLAKTVEWTEHMLALSFKVLSQKINSVQFAKGSVKRYMKLQSKFEPVMNCVVRLFSEVCDATTEDIKPFLLPTSLPAALKILFNTVAFSELAVRCRAPLVEAVHDPDRLLFFSLLLAIKEVVKRTESFSGVSRFFHMVATMETCFYPAPETRKETHLFGNDMYPFYGWFLIIHFIEQFMPSKDNEVYPTSVFAAAPLQKKERRLQLEILCSQDATLPRLGAAPQTIASLCILSECIRAVISKTVINFEPKALAAILQTEEHVYYQELSPSEFVETVLEDLGLSFEESEEFYLEFFKQFTGESPVHSDGTPLARDEVDFIYAKALREYCTPFVRRAALLNHAIGLGEPLSEKDTFTANIGNNRIDTFCDEYFASFFDTASPSEEQKALAERMRAGVLRREQFNADRSDNFVALLDRLGIPHYPCFFVPGAPHTPCAVHDAVERLLHSWITSEPLGFLQTGLTHFSAVPRAIPFHLIALPERFDTVIRIASQTCCQKCGEIPKKPAICLTCGAVLCHFSHCCSSFSSTPGQEVGELGTHSYSCCSVGAYLIVERTSVVLNAPEKGIYYKEYRPIYLDKNGEDDLDLKRGAGLFLDHKRYDFICRKFMALQLEDYCDKDNEIGRDPRMTLS